MFRMTRKECESELRLNQGLTYSVHAISHSHKGKVKFRMKMIRRISITIT